MAQSSSSLPHRWIGHISKLQLWYDFNWAHMPSDLLYSGCSLLIHEFHWNEHLYWRAIAAAQFAKWLMKCNGNPCAMQDISNCKHESICIPKHRRIESIGQKVNRYFKIQLTLVRTRRVFLFDSSSPLNFVTTNTIYSNHTSGAIFALSTEPLMRQHAMFIGCHQSTIKTMRQQ